jgi:hypothetical protein
MAGAESYTESSMQNTIEAAILRPAEVGLVTSRTLGCQAAVVLCSQVPGRQRWYVDALEDNPRLAAAVELVLKSEEGILDAHANPLTGRVLVHYQPDLPSETIEALIQRALEFGPMSREEFSSLHSKKPGTQPFRHLLAAEIGCTAFKWMFLGGCCPLVLGAASLLLFVDRRA